MFDLLLSKYNDVLLNLQNGHPLSNSDIDDLMWLLHILHFVSLEQASSDESLKILAYYG
jgi:hypothetical protein